MPPLQVFAEHSTREPRVSAQSSKLRRARLFLREALRDNDEDFTTGPIGRALGLLAIPMMLEMAMESVFAVVDIAFVSRLGTDAVAAVLVEHVFGELPGPTKQRNRAQRRRAGLVGAHEMAINRRRIRTSGW